MASANHISRLAGLPRWWNRGAVRLLVVAAVVALLSGVAWLAGRRKDSPHEEPIIKEMIPAPVALAKDVYLLGESAPAAVYAVDTSAGLVLIDTGIEPKAAGVLRQLARLHLDVDRLQAILLTHAHADHSTGAEYLRSRTGAKIYAGRGDARTLATGGPREAFVSTFHMPFYVPHPIRVDVQLQGDETIAFGQTQFTVIEAPGHSPGSVCYLLQRDGLRALFAGDVIQSLSRSSNRRQNPLGTYAAYLPPRYRGSARDYLATLRRLRALPVPDLLLPGHPRIDPVPQSPHLSEKQWHDLLDDGIREMEQLLARYKTDGANFLDGTARELLPGLHYLGDLDRSAVYCLSTPQGLFLVDAPGGPKLLDFLAGCFKRLGWQGRKPTAVLLTSAGERSTAGLKALVADTGCQVVVSKAGVEEVRGRCPAGARILNEDELSTTGWFAVRTIPLAGRGLAPLAYVLRWAGKSVVLSGEIPVKLTDGSVEQLQEEVRASGGGGLYVQSLGRLGQVKPDLWLPAVPIHGQNANLYDDDWAKLLSQNARVFPSADER